MDATDPNAPFGILPPNVLNGQGRIVNKGQGDWINLYSSKKYNDLLYINAKINEDLTIEADFSYKALGYAAFNLRKKYRKEESEADFIEEFKTNFSGLEFSEYSIEDIDSLHKPVVIKGKIKLSDKISSVNDLLFFTPKILGKEEQIFKSDKREYPIDFNFPIANQTIISIELPDGYIVDEKPEPLKIALPESKGMYVFMLKSIGNKIQITTKKQISETVFSGLNYPEIKKFFDLIVAKEAEKITLKKSE